jgi:hypothetical protein
MSETPTPAPVPGYDRGEAGDKLAAAIERGARARALLENELFRDAFQDARGRLHRRLEDLAGGRYRRPRWARCATISPASSPTAGSRSAN